MCYDADPKSVTPLTILNYINTHTENHWSTGPTTTTEEYIVWFSSLSIKNANEVLAKLKKRYAVKRVTVKSDV
uniref:HTH_48 domain-containing protein n=1 Tax=Globodera pallida TaxID=36090 RepID=A0A183BXI7_GLOPA